MTYSIEIQKLSLEPGQVGTAITTFALIEFDDGINALREMNKIINELTGDTRRILLRMPNGDRLPFNAAFTEIVGVEPKHDRNHVRVTNAPWSN